MNHKRYTPMIGIVLSLFLSACAGAQDGSVRGEMSESVSGLQAGGSETPPPAQGTAPPAPEADEVRDQYVIDLSLDVEHKTITGTAAITVNNTSSDEWRQLGLREYISSLYDSMEELSGQRPEGTNELLRITDLETGRELTFARDPEEASMVYVDLERPLAPGGQMQIEIEFFSDIPQDAPRFRWTQPEDGKITFELAHFYPALAVYEDGTWHKDPFTSDFGESFYSRIADYTIHLTVPEGFTVVASGGEELTGTGNGKSTWSITAEKMRDVAITVSNHLKKLSGMVNGVELNSYYFDKEDAEKQGQIMLQSGMEAIDLFSRCFGQYPYESLDLVMNNDFAPGLEYPALVRIFDYSDGLGENGEDGGEREEMTIGSLKGITAHEVAHQWFYAVVGNNQEREPWLDESLASFADLIYESEYGSKEEMKQLVEQNRRDADYYKGIFLNDPKEEQGPLFSTSMYFRGEAFLFDLMQLMGEEKFFKMMQDYYQTFGFQEAHTRDFVNLVFRYDDSEEVKALLSENLRLN